MIGGWSLILGLQGITNGPDLDGGAECLALQRVTYDPLEWRLGCLWGGRLYHGVTADGFPHLDIDLCCALY